MPIELKVPSLGESVSSAVVARWIKQPGEAVAADEAVAELETDKVTVEVTAPSAGVLASIAVPEGTEVAVGALLGMLEAGGAAVAAPVAMPAPAPEPPPAPAPTAGVQPPPRPVGPVARPAAPPPAPLPAAQRMIEEHGLSAEAIGPGTAKDGRLSKGDVMAFMARPAAPPPAPTTAPAASAPKPAPTSATKIAAPPARSAAPRAADAREERVRMTRLRKTIATRLKEAQNTAAMLTTFNEVDMTALRELRDAYRDEFAKRHGGVRLGFMSFFVRACCAAVRDFPAVNAEIDGDDIVYKNFVHMGIAVGGANGLVVPVVRDADTLGLAGIEAAIADFGARARDGGLRLDELTGGTFSISNGGVYGSLMSTPILNPPQSGILGMHKIQDRPIAVGGKIEIRPMMYLALSYDHRIVDGREAVGFLVRVKESIEDPRRLLLDI